MRRFCQSIAVAFVVLGPCLAAAQTPGNSTTDRAKRILDLLVREQFDEVAREFNEKMTAAMPVTRLRDTWTKVRQQAGAYVSAIDESVTAPGPGFTAVVLGCQFERAALNIRIGFDGQNKIGGFGIVPRPPASEPPATPTSTKFKDEQVTIGTGPWTLPATLSMPVGPVAGAIALVHGSGPHDRDETIGPNKPFRDLAWGLADRGIAVLRYEKRTRHYPGKSSGSKDYTVREEVLDDALAAAAFLRTRERIDPKRVFVLGHSLGGTVAPRIADEDRTLAGLVILAGVTRPVFDVVREQLAYLASLNPGTIDQEQALDGLKRAAPESYWRDLDAHKPAEIAKKLTLPMLILQGERDYQVTMADLQGWKDALGVQPRVTIKSYPTLNHLFLAGEGRSTPAEYQRPGQIPDFVFDDVAAWIKSVR
jgi:uncharacterized protein